MRVAGVAGRYVAIALLAWCALALTGGDSSEAAPPIDDSKYVLLGKQSDCDLRTGNKQYCADLFATISSLNSYWATLFPKLVPAGQRITWVAPRVKYFRLNTRQLEDRDCENEATPADLCQLSFHYGGEKPGVIQPADAIVINERPFIAAYSDTYGKALMSAFALNWSTHARLLLGRGEAGEPGVAFASPKDSLEGICYVGMWLSSRDSAGDLTEDEWLGVLDLVYGASQDTHGLGPQRVSAVRVGFSFQSHQHCMAWRSPLEDIVLSWQQYAIAVPPGTTENWKDAPVPGSSALLLMEKTDAEVYVFYDRPAATAEAQLARLLQTAIGAHRTLGAIEDAPHPYYGKAAASEIEKGVRAAVRYEKSQGANSFHGTAYVHVRPRGGSMLILNAQGGLATKPDWVTLEDDLWRLILGVSLE